MSGEDFQLRVNSQGQSYIDGLKAAVAQLWKKCCEEDKIPPESKFVVFSPGNRFLLFYNNAMAQLREAEANYRAGGYVGLRVEGGRTNAVKFTRAHSRHTQQGPRGRPA